MGDREIRLSVAETMGRLWMKFRRMKRARAGFLNFTEMCTKILIKYSYEKITKYIENNK